MKNVIITSFCLLLIVSFFLIFCGCGGDDKTPLEPQNAPPTITNFTATPTNLFSGDSSKLVVKATDPDGSNLTYTWNASGGSFIPPTDKDSVIWKAPDASGSFVVSIRVSDGEDTISDSLSIEVSLTPITGEWRGTLPGLVIDLDITENTNGDISGGGDMLINTGQGIFFFGISANGSRNQNNVTIVITNPGFINPTTFTGTVNNDATEMSGRLTTTTGLDEPFTFSRTGLAKSSTTQPNNKIDWGKLLK